MLPRICWQKSLWIQKILNQLEKKDPKKGSPLPPLQKKKRKGFIGGSWRIPKGSHVLSPSLTVETEGECWNNEIKFSRFAYYFLFDSFGSRKGQRAEAKAEKFWISTCWNWKSSCCSATAPSLQTDSFSTWESKKLYIKQKSLKESQKIPSNPSRILTNLFWNCWLS